MGRARHSNLWIQVSLCACGWSYYSAIFRSCVIFVDDDKLLAVGINGLDYSDDGGDNWQNVKKGEVEDKLGWNSISQDIQTGLFWIVGQAGAVGTLNMDLKNKGVF